MDSKGSQTRAPSAEAGAAAAGVGNPSAAEPALLSEAEGGRLALKLQRQVGRLYCISMLVLASFFVTTVCGNTKAYITMEELKAQPTAVGFLTSARLWLAQIDPANFCDLRLVYVMDIVIFP